jgi:SPP1 gp7 family putative phage head morphogenesis protein
MPLVTNAVRISKARKKNDPSLRPIKAGLNKQEKEIFDIYMRALSGMSSDMNNSNVLRAIQEAVAAGNPLDASVAFQWEEFISSLNSVVPNLANQVASSANISAKNLPKRISIESNFTAVDPRAIAWAQQRAGARIQGITQESQKAVAESIVNGLKGGLTRDEVITRLRKIVGLDARQARALGAFYEKNLQQLLEEGYTYEEALAEVTKTSEQYRQRLLTQRATRIARTETLAAANAGRMLSWGEADAQGILPPDSMKRWKTATDERTCPICQPMHNVAVQWQSAFSTGDVMPPAHPNCRCTAVIVPGTFTFEKSKERVIKQTKANSWLFVKHMSGKHDQKTHGKGNTFSFTETKSGFRNEISMSDETGKFLADVVYVEGYQIEIEMIRSVVENKGNATRVVDELYQRNPDKNIYWGKTIEPNSTYLAQKFSDKYGRTEFMPWGNGVTEGYEWGQTYGNPTAKVQKHAPGKHDQKTHGKGGGGKSSVFYESGGELSNALSLNARELKEAQITLELMEDVIGDEFKSDEGVKFTKFALESDLGDTKVIIAKTEDGLAGAISYNEMSKEIIDSVGTYLPTESPEPHMYIQYLGSTGLVDGTGTALADAVFQEAADKGLGVMLESASVGATAFWEKIGLEMIDDFVMPVYGLSASKVKELVNA